MGYWTAAERWADTLDYQPVLAGARTATFTTSSTEFGDREVARLKINVTAASGTSPTLNVTVQTSSDGSTWYTSGTFTQATGVTSEQKLFLLDRFVRVVNTIAGTSPSFTYSILGEVA